MGFRLASIAGRAALVEGDNYYDLETVSNGALGSDPMEALAAPDELASLTAGLASAEPTGSLGDVVLDAPVPRPQKSFAIGLNYKNHAAESNMELPENPLVFTKFPSCLVGPTANVEMRSDRCDYEAELVVVIGEGGKDIAEADAWNHVAGLMCGQDVSDRATQFAAKPPHFDLGKSFDTFGPTGPYVVSLDHFDDYTSLAISCHINGEQRQNDRTDNLIFSIPKLINYISSITTLVTGDLIFTGTPEGVGAASRTYLQDGDVITTTIEGIGTMTNTCVRVGNYR